MMSNNNGDQLITKLLSSDLVKTIIAIVVTVASMSYGVFNATNDLKESMKDIKHQIELQNQALEFRLKELQEKQERDYRYIIENFSRKGAK